MPEQRFYKFQFQSIPPKEASFHKLLLHVTFTVSCYKNICSD